MIPWYHNSMGREGHFCSTHAVHATNARCPRYQIKFLVSPQREIKQHFYTRSMQQSLHSCDAGCRSLGGNNMERKITKEKAHRMLSETDRGIETTL
jgi:hypothetical protein